jgi:hypothetical protein
VGARAEDDVAIAEHLLGAEQQLRPVSISEALDHRYAWLADHLPNDGVTGPINAEALLFATDPPPPGPLLRWAKLRWALVPNALGAPSPTAAGALWARLAGRAPVFTLLYTPGTEQRRGSFTARWIPDVGQDAPLETAFAAWRAQAVSSAALIDGRPAFHPLYWARWRLVQP